MSTGFPPLCVTHISLILVQCCERTERNDQSGLMVFVSLWDINIQPNVSDNRASGHKDLAGQTALLSCWSGMMLAHVGDQMLEYTSCFLFTATSHIRLSHQILLYYVFQLEVFQHVSILGFSIAHYFMLSFAVS